jgi:ATP-dependent Clp protease ATP-binding subunit ClpB
MARLEKLLAERKIEIELDDKAREWLAAAGYDPAFGARPLKRVIQKAVQDPLAEAILSGEVKDGSRLQLSADDEGLVLDGKPMRSRQAFRLGEQHSTMRAPESRLIN